MRNSSRRSRSGSAASRAAACASEYKSVIRWVSGEAGQRKAEPVERGAVVEPRAGGFVELQRRDAGAGFLFAERERVVGAQHHAVDAAGVEQVLERTGIGDPRIEEEPRQV